MIGRTREDPPHLGNTHTHIHTQTNWGNQKTPQNNHGCKLRLQSRCRATATMQHFVHSSQKQRVHQIPTRATQSWTHTPTAMLAAFPGHGMVQYKKARSVASSVPPSLFSGKPIGPERRRQRHLEVLLAPRRREPSSYHLADEMQTITMTRFVEIHLAGAKRTRPPAPSPPEDVFRPVCHPTPVRHVSAIRSNV